MEPNKKDKKIKKEKKNKINTRNKINEKKAKVKDTIDEEIEKASKEMEELVNSIQGELGNENVKVVKLSFPKPSFKTFFIELLICLGLNMLLILGTSGFINFFLFDSILDLVLYSVYFTLVERIISFIFSRFFMPLVIRSMGLALAIPPVLTLLICLLFPIFVGIENIVVAILAMVFISICRSYILNYIRNKILIGKLRRKK